MGVRGAMQSLWSKRDVFHPFVAFSTFVESLSMNVLHSREIRLKELIHSTEVLLKVSELCLHRMAMAMAMAMVMVMVMVTVMLMLMVMVMVTVTVTVMLMIAISS